MSISITRYVDITSGVGAGVQVQGRDLIGRIFSTNELIPTKSLLEFTDAQSVGTYFGTSSDEYARAAMYFSFVSKNITRPQKFQFYRWTDDDEAPQIFGSPITTTLGQFQAISNGAISITLGAITHIVSSIDFSAAVSLAGVAAVLQTKIRAADANNQWDQCTVTYSGVGGVFNFVGGDPVAAVVSTAEAGTGTEIIDLIGWGTDAIFSNGALEETITEVLTESAAVSDNFGSFLFNSDLTLDEILEAAIWNSTQNVKFQYYVRVLAADASSYSAALFSIPGCGMTLAPLSTEYPEQDPMCTLAATDYTARNGTQNFMFQDYTAQTPSVTSDADANTYDALRINYYGETQTAGQKYRFYQRGVLFGTATNPLDMNTYANEQWLKDAATTALMTLVLALARVPANANGRSQVLTVLQTVVEQALFNGTISPGKPLTTVQKMDITELSGNALAWYQVQNNGYWVNAIVVPDENLITYILIYSKDDVVRKITGQHVLI